MKGFAKVFILSFIFAAFALSAYITFAVTLPDTFNGTLTINGVPAPDNIEIRAEINGNDRTCEQDPPGPFLSSGGSYVIKVCGLDDEVQQTITFLIECSQNNFVASAQTGTFSGQQNVQLDLTATCQGVCIPSAEICDGIDNDCDQAIDEGNPGGNQACTTGQPGVCSAGTTACTNGAIVCNQNTQSTPEVCDSLDNDCDGVADDGNPGGGASCSTGQPGVCSAGTTVCTNGAIVCNQNTQSSPEVCDSLDNDCDGQTDEGDVCSLPCPDTDGDGFTNAACGGTDCNDNNPNVHPGATEVCNSIDDNCANGIDEGFDVGAACSAGVGACQTFGVKVCSQDGTTTACSAQPGTPTAEICNAIDDNCDGTVDDFSQSCYTGPQGTEGVGVCHAGTHLCTAGSFGACNNEVTPTAEVCDTLDNNCNGTPDEGGVCSAPEFCIIITNMSILDSNFNVANTIIPGNLYNVRVSNTNVCQDPITSMQIVQIMKGLLPVNLATVTSTIGSGQTSVITVGFILSSGAVPGNTYTATAFNWNKWIDQPSPPAFQILSETSSASFTVAV